MKIYQRLIRKPMQSSGSQTAGTDGTGGSKDSSNTHTTGSSAGTGAASHTQAARFAMPAGMKLLWSVALVFVFGLLPACSSTPSTQRFAFAVRDGDTLLPVPDTKATVNLSRPPVWFEGQPIYLTMDNVGMDHALLVLNQTAYKVELTHEGYNNACFNLPVLNRQFPFGKWLAAIRCEHPGTEPCTDSCQVSRLELMVTEPMPE